MNGTLNNPGQTVLFETVLGFAGLIFFQIPKREGIAEVSTSSMRIIYIRIRRIEAKLKFGIGNNYSPG